MSASAVAQTYRWIPLLQEVLQQHGQFRWPLRGESMLPTLLSGSEIAVAPLTRPPRIGDLVVFVNGDTLVAHRLVAHHGNQWLAQGDGCRHPDAPLDASQLIGLVVAAYRHGQRYWPGPLMRPAELVWVARARGLHLLHAISRIAEGKRFHE